MSLTRTIKFEVTFPGLRAADLLAVKGGLRLMSLDLTRAANKAISAMWLLQLGQIPWPTAADNKQKPLQTLAYQLMSGEWQPMGRPCYEPSPGAHPANSAVLLQLSTDVLTRIKTDVQDIKAGRKSLATFREIPIPVVGKGVTLHDDGSITLAIRGMTAAPNGKMRRATQLRVRPRKLDGSLNAIMHRLREGRYKTGCAKLFHESRSGKWFLSVAWTDAEHTSTELPVATEEAAGSIVAGVDTGIQHACWISYVDGATGEPLKRPDVIGFPSRTLRAVARLRKERNERLTYNRAPLGLREGRGRTRKLRVVAAIGEKVSRTNTTMVAQIAAATVAKIKERGACTMVIEDHSHWSTAAMHAAADEHGGSAAARIRASYFRWHQGAMREALKAVGAREGLQVIEINPANTSRTCHRCGAVWSRDWIKNPPVGDEPAFGRVKLRLFRCECGFEGHADHNAAVNIARRGMDRVRTAAVKKKPAAK